MKNILFLLFAAACLCSAKGQSSYSLSNSGIPSNFNTYDFIAASNELFAVGATFNSGPAAGIYRSNNNGQTWNTVTTTGLQNHSYLYSAAVAAGSTYFLAASSNTGSYGIYSSSNGLNWNLSNSGIPANFVTMDFIAASATNIFAVGAAFNGTTFIPGIYESANSGTSWTALNITGLQNHNYLYSASIRIGNKMLLNASNTTPNYAIYSSIDGASWSLSNFGIPANFNTYDFIVSSPSEVYAVGAFTGSTPTPGVYKSVDAGASWTSYPVTGMANHNYLYTASTKAGNSFFINSSNSIGGYAIYRSELPVLSGLKEITSFKTPDMIGGEVINSIARTVTLQVSSTTDLSQISPTIGISTSANISPASGQSRDFTQPVAYTVTAQDGSSNVWTVAIEKEVLSGLSRNTTASNFMFGPNPCNHEIQIDGELFGEAISFELVDLNNKVVAKTADDGSKILSVSHVPEGIYFLRSQSHTTSALKVVIIR